MAGDEWGTLLNLDKLRREVIDPVVGRHSGRLFKAVGDGFLIEFASAVQAVSCAVEIQKTGPALPLRIGIHLGDVVVQGDDLMGDGVNIAARIEGVAEWAASHCRGRCCRTSSTPMALGALLPDAASIAPFVS